MLKWVENAVWYKVLISSSIYGHQWGNWDTGESEFACFVKTSG